MMMTTMTTMRRMSEMHVAKLDERRAGVEDERLH
jgi:hypothetical protein